MIKGDEVRLLFWEAAPTLMNTIGTVEEWREVGQKLENIEYEYLIKFGDGTSLWVPSRYLRRL
jgi:hypothetical protein